MLFYLLGLVCLALAGLRTWNYLQYRKRRRSRKNQKLDLLTIGLYIAAVLLVLVGLLSGIPGEEPKPTDPTEPPTQNATTEPTEEPTDAPITGWDGYEGRRRYLQADGTYAKGWLDLDGKRYYLDEDGLTLSGWQEVEGITRYFRSDGSMARGEEIIDGKTYFFTSTGVEILVANPWNYIPEGYEVELADLSVHYSTEGGQIAASIYDPLIEMMDACNELSGARCCVVSGYRTHEYQTDAYESLVWDLINNEGKSEEDARAEAATRIAIPGTSEHQLGLAADIIDTELWSLELEQENLTAQKWLMEHCWEYGFILRYPNGKTDSTGIIYEPWHYRYVGLELAKELHDSGLTLEEYIASLD